MDTSITVMIVTMRTRRNTQKPLAGTLMDAEIYLIASASVHKLIVTTLYESTVAQNSRRKDSQLFFQSEMSLIWSFMMHQFMM